ncbi:hypothetical protein ACVWY3_000986 [Bradyrhizobium sp. USDA 4486]
MSNVEEFPLSARRQPTEFEALVAAGGAALDAIPGAVYLCDANGVLVGYNTEAVQLWDEHRISPRRSASAGRINFICSMERR